MQKNYTLILKPMSQADPIAGDTEFEREQSNSYLNFFIIELKENKELADL
jgi:hypothetical protein